MAEGEKVIDWAGVVAYFKRLKIVRTVCVWHVWAALFLLCIAVWAGVFKLMFYARDLLAVVLCR